MSWIEVPDETGASPELRAALDAARDPRSGELDNILAVHGLHPAGLSAHLALYEAVMRGTRTLRKVERELIAFVVSALNGCHY
jgi:alkylhydroperoxidase family enzyme